MLWYISPSCVHIRDGFVPETLCKMCKCCEIVFLNISKPNWFVLLAELSRCLVVMCQNKKKGKWSQFQDLSVSQVQSPHDLFRMRLPLPCASTSLWISGNFWCVCGGCLTHCVKHLTTSGSHNKESCDAW